MNTPALINAATLKDWLTAPATVTVIDVRSPAEFQTSHIAGSYNVPLQLLGEHAAQFTARLDHHVVLVCQSGTRATEAQTHLHKAGHQNLHVLDKGVPGYIAAGGKTVTGQAAWSIERQVRGVAGTLVLAATLIGRRAPKVTFLATGIGAGLTLSALTNTCTMGRILMTLPHNKGAKPIGLAQALQQLPQR